MASTTTVLAALTNAKYRELASSVSEDLMLTTSLLGVSLSQNGSPKYWY